MDKVFSYLSHYCQIKIQKFQILFLTWLFIGFQLLFFQNCACAYLSTMILRASSVNVFLDKDASPAGLVCIFFFHAWFCIWLSCNMGCFLIIFWIISFYQQFRAQYMALFSLLFTDSPIFLPPTNFPRMFYVYVLTHGWKCWITLSLMLIPKEPPRITSIWWWFTTD